MMNTLRTNNDERGGVAADLAVVGMAGVMVVGAAMHFGALPNPFEGGKPDPAPKGDVVYQGQTAVAISDRFLVEVGKGEAIVAVRATQDWDRRHGIDWKPGPNGTSSIRDPKEPNQPAKLKVETRYCADGTVEVEKEKTATTDQPETVKKVTFNLGKYGVCDALFLIDNEHPGNAAAIHQDNTPPDWHGEFVGFVTGAVQESAKAAECPTGELEKYNAPVALQHIQQKMAEKFQISREQVTVQPAEIVVTEGTTKDMLRKNLDRYANKQDPKDASKTYPSLNISFYGAHNALDKSCFMDRGSRDLKTLDEITPPTEQ